METPAPGSLRHFLEEHRAAPRYYATGRKSGDHWELHIDGIGTTQAAPGESHRTTILNYADALGHNTQGAHVFIHYPGHPAP